MGGDLHGERVVVRRWTGSGTVQRQAERRAHEHAHLQFIHEAPGAREVDTPPFQLYIQPSMRAEDVARTMAEQCLAIRSRRLSRVVTRLFDAALRPLGLTPAQLTVLVVVERGGPAAPSVVARALDVDKSTLSRNLRRMVAAGWVRERSDGALKRVELTRAGRELLAAAHPLWRRAQQRAHDLLGARIVDALMHLDT